MGDKACLVLFRRLMLLELYQIYDEPSNIEASVSKGLVNLQCNFLIESAFTEAICGCLYVSL